ncbi:type II secretion system F family protein [Vibrio sp. SCSIO 43137]|uniref:type II secretion system F family protein n=1 Tax=Vibrio sp. SCSIO 43137 TaxID=3021011 RepID=UPI002306F7FA|nr:type II secretion system F family protein [Vibrio sp. SCSIO 43137]WCE29231.1 type II secretion system F family protein [Vibrio sp. SCSIO 43137]
MPPTETHSYNFVWKGTGSTGSPESGTVLAQNRTDAIIKLNKRHIRVQAIKQQRKPLSSRLSNKIKPTDITQVTKQLATTLSSGIPLAQSLEIIVKNSNNQPIKRLLSQLQLKIESGYSLSYALSEHSALFGTYFISLTETGESTGQLDKVLAKLAQQREKSERLSQKLLKSLLYPTVVLITAIAVSVLLLTQVVPQFASLFHSFNADLPLFTQQIIVLSDWIQAQAVVLCLCAALLFISFMVIHRYSEVFRYTLSKYSLSVPVYGRASSEASLAAFSHSLSLNLSSGVPILRAVENASRSSYNRHYQALFHSAVADVSAGTALHHALEQKSCFPDYFIQMIMIGEQSGTLDEMLERISEHYELSVDNLADNLSNLLEPFIMLILGVLVGGIIISMYLPIFNLMSLMG